ncbi:MAG TPA: hypothetical protein VFF39_03880, partial [Verrucomicrobiae bacterium]|nr:hypothetical protein [Verrucomicrobiae bacterium]
RSAAPAPTAIAILQPWLSPFVLFSCRPFLLPDVRCFDIKIVSGKAGLRYLPGELTGSYVFMAVSSKPVLWIGLSVLVDPHVPKGEKSRAGYNTRVVLARKDAI